MVVRWEARDVVGVTTEKSALDHTRQSCLVRALCQEKMLHRCRSAWRRRFSSPDPMPELQRKRWLSVALRQHRRYRKTALVSSSRGP